MNSNINVIDKGFRDWSNYNIKLIPSETKLADSPDSAVSANMGLYCDEKGKFCTSGIVGIGWLKNNNNRIIVDQKTGQKQAIIIRPRFTINPWAMLVRVMNDPEHIVYFEECKKNNKKIFEIFTNEKLIPVNGDESGGELLAAISLIKECEIICKKRLVNCMTFHDNNFNGRIVGNIHVPKHLKYNVFQGREDRIYCKYPVFTVDTLENRIVKASLKKAIALVRSKKYNFANIDKIYHYCENALKNVRAINVSKSDFNHINLTGFNSYYKPLMELAKIIIYQKGVNGLAENAVGNKNYVIPYAINMESLFEFYVRAVIKETIQQNSWAKVELDDFRSALKNPLLTLKNDDGKASLLHTYVPDIAFMNDEKNKYLGVYDVKYQYQRNSKKKNPNTDRRNSHQLLFYTLLLNVKNCGFIFPKQNTYSEELQGKSYVLDIKNGNATNDEVTERQYSEWFLGFSHDKEKDFVAELLRIVYEF